jgi:DNA-binding transcriptional LysR family regulator
MRIDLEGLEALDAVVRYGGLAHAAKRLHKVQSTVSYQLRKLEQQLGTQVLDRSGYRVRLTTAGEAILAEGRRLLAEARRVEALAQQLAGGWEARLLVIVDGILPTEPMLAAFKALAEERIPTRFQAKVEFMRGVQFCFDRDDADLMLVKDYTPQPWLQTEDLPEIECILCVAPSHALAPIRGVDLDQLQDHVELSVQDSSGTHDDPHGFGGERVFHLSDFGAKKQALLMGVGFGWMPAYLVSEELQSGRLRELDYAGGSRYRFTPRLVWRTDRPPGPAGRRLADLVRTWARSAEPSGRRVVRPGSRKSVNTPRRRSRAGPSGRTR